MVLISQTGGFNLRRAVLIIEKGALIPGMGGFHPSDGRFESLGRMVLIPGTDASDGQF